MAKKKEILVDANSFIALNWTKDTTHKKAKLIFEKLKKENCILWTNNYLASEVLTVLLQKLKNVKLVARIGKELYSPSKYIKLFQIPKSLQFISLKIFSQQEKPKLSFADCTLIAQAKEQKIKNIFTFDRNLRKSKFLKACHFYP